MSRQVLTDSGEGSKTRPARDEIMSLKQLAARAIPEEDVPIMRELMRTLDIGDINALRANKLNLCSENKNRLEEMLRHKNGRWVPYSEDTPSLKLNITEEYYNHYISDNNTYQELYQMYDQIGPIRIHKLITEIMTNTLFIFMIMNLIHYSLTLTLPGWFTNYNIFYSGLYIGLTLLNNLMIANILKYFKEKRYRKIFIIIFSVFYILMLMVLFWHDTGYHYLIIPVINLSYKKINIQLYTYQKLICSLKSIYNSFYL